MTTLFISDLHLSASRPKTSELFLRFLEKDAKAIDALYILGDFFEAWIGEDIMDDHDTEILKAIKLFSQKTPVYFMPGNRDFLINAQIANRFGMTYLSDPTVIQLYKQPVLLMHGDSLCTLDKKYQYYRRFVQHPLIQKAFLSLPVFLRKSIADKLRKKPFSRNHGNQETTGIGQSYKNNEKNHKAAYWDVVQESVEAALKKHQSQLLIHGHTHKPGIHDFVLNNKPAKRMVMGDWNNTGSVLMFTPEQQSLQTIC